MVSTKLPEHGSATLFAQALLTADLVSDRPSTRLLRMANEGKTIGDRFELIGGGQAALAEALHEQATDGGHEGCAAREEDALDLLRLHAGLSERLVHRAGDLLNILTDPTLEVGPGDPR